MQFLNAWHHAHTGASDANERSRQACQPWISYILEIIPGPISVTDGVQNLPSCKHPWNGDADMQFTIYISNSNVLKCAPIASYAAVEILKWLPLILNADCMPQSPILGNATDVQCYLRQPRSIRTAHTDQSP